VQAISTGPVRGSLRGGRVAPYIRQIAIPTQTARWNLGITKRVAAARVVRRGSHDLQSPPVRPRGWSPGLEELPEAFRERRVGRSHGRVGGPGPPGVDIVAEVAAADLFERRHRTVLHGGVGILEGFGKDGNRRAVAEFAEHPQGPQADVEIAVGTIPGGEEWDRIGTAARPPHFAGPHPHGRVGVLEGTPADRGGRGRVESAGDAHDRAAHAGIMFLEDAAGEILREGDRAIGTRLRRLPRLVFDRLDPLIGGGAVALGQAGRLFAILPWPRWLPGPAPRASAGSRSDDPDGKEDRDGARRRRTGRATTAIRGETAGRWQRSGHDGRIVSMEWEGGEDRTEGDSVEPDQSPPAAAAVACPTDAGRVPDRAGRGALGKCRGLWCLAVLATVAVADPPAPPVAAHARFTVEGSGGRREVEGRVIVESLDGAALVETPDGRLELLQSDAIRDRTDMPEPPEEVEPRAFARRVIAELPAGFDYVLTKHYLVCHDTSKGYAQWCASLFERLHEAFVNYWRRAGLEPSGVERPLVVVVFADRERYEAFAAADLGAAADRVVGYYNLLSNRVTTFDLTGRDGPGGGATGAGRAGLEVLASPAAAGLVSTLVHEATHQMAFNTGLHRRLAPVPLWVSEGVATYFETPDLSAGRGWRGLGGVNRSRAERFLAAARPVRLGPLVTDDAPFRDPDAALDAYAGAWALTAFLLQTRKDDFVAYQRILAAKMPLGEDSPAVRRADFVAAFGVDPEALDEPVARYVARLR